MFVWHRQEHRPSIYLCLFRSIGYSGHTGTNEFFRKQTHGIIHVRLTWWSVFICWCTYFCLSMCNSAKLVKIFKEERYLYFVNGGFFFKVINFVGQKHVHRKKWGATCRGQENIHSTQPNSMAKRSIRGNVKSFGVVDVFLTNDIVKTLFKCPVINTLPTSLPIPTPPN